MHSFLNVEMPLRVQRYDVVELPCDVETSVSSLYYRLIVNTLVFDYDSVLVTHFCCYRYMWSFSVLRKTTIGIDWS